MVGPEIGDTEVIGINRTAIAVSGAPRACPPRHRWCGRKDRPTPCPWKITLQFRSACGPALHLVPHQRAGLQFEVPVQRDEASAAIMGWYWDASLVTIQVSWSAS